jgi:hypothetical protein
VGPDVTTATSCGPINSVYAPRWKCSTLPTMQRNGDQLGLLEPSRDIQENRIPSEDCDPLLDAKDQTIAELKEQIAFLRRELERKDEIMLRMAGGNSSSLLATASEPMEGLHSVASGEGWDGNRASDAKEERKRVILPDGYRVVAFASDAWVLIAPRGLRVAAYRGELDLQKVALDARKHHQSEE